MKRFLLAAIVVVMSSAAADAGPLRNLVSRIRCGDGPVRRAAKYVAQERPVATAMSDGFYAAGQVAAARPVANFVQTRAGGCPSCPSFSGSAK